MKYYYYRLNDDPLGPFTFEELRSKRLKRSTLLWTEGMPEWTKGYEIEELREILIAEPPPFPTVVPTPPLVGINNIPQLESEGSNTKYDYTYTKETEITIIGVMLFAIPLIIKYTGLLTFESYETYDESRYLLAFISIMVRIGVTVWVVDIANRQNRNTTGWGWFAFLLPAISLIFIGQLRKLRLSFEIDENLPLDQKIQILFNKANKLFYDSRYVECIEILDKAIEIDRANNDCIKLRAISYFNIRNYVKAKNDFEKLLEFKMNLDSAYYYLGNLAIMDKDRELAVSYWLKSQALNNEAANEKVDNYHTYTGTYVLEEWQTKRKVISKHNTNFIYFNDGRYERGLPQIDNFEKTGSLKTQITGYDLGLDIELRRIFKTYHLGIGFYEIDNIIFKESECIFELHLVDQSILLFSYDRKKDFNFGLKMLCIKFQENTGKIPDALASWKD